MILLHADVLDLEKLAGFAEEICPHLHGRGARLRIDPAAMGDADYQVEVAHHLAENAWRHGESASLAAFAIALLKLNGSSVKPSTSSGVVIPSS